MPSILSIGEAARALHLSTATLYKLCRKGGLPHARLFNSIRIARADLERYLAAHVVA